MLSVVVITMDIAHVAGNLDLMTAAALAYGPLYLLTFVFLCLGFAGQPIVHNVQARSRERMTRGLVGELEPLWERPTSVRPGISQNEDAEFKADEPETLLHRQIVEIRDAMIDTRVAFEVSDEELELVERAESHLTGAMVARAHPEAERHVGAGRRRQER